MAVSPISRRQFAAGSAGLIATAAFVRPAAAGETITAVEWGGPWLDASKAVLAEQNRFEVNWVLHAGGAAAIVPKIKAALPRVNYDIVHSFPPVTYPMMHEGWLEPLRPEEIPNMHDVPEQFWIRDGEGNIVNCPTSQIGACWGYRTDLIKKPIEKAEDLLDPNLKGKILFLDPTLQSARLLLSLALERGGDERNIDPGFEFAKELARSGNVGRVAKSDVEVLNSITTGETAIAFTQNSAWAKIAESQPVKYLIKLPQSHKMFKIFGSQEEWTLLKGAPNKQAAKEFINWFLSPEVHQKYAELMGVVPVNRKSRPSAKVAFLAVDNNDDRQRYQYFPDYAYIATQLKGWTERWEKEVSPLF
jgi:putative spermidine/putrescine transport system substrate-binding protein